MFGSLVKPYLQVTELDKLHSQQQTEGENKYSTIQKVAIGKPMRFMELFVKVY